MLVIPSIPMDTPVVEKAQDTFTKAKSAQEHVTSQAVDALAKIAPGIHLPPIYTNRIEPVPAATLQRAQEVTPTLDDVASQNDNNYTGSFLAPSPRQQNVKVLQSALAELPDSPMVKQLSALLNKYATLGTLTSPTYSPESRKYLESTTRGFSQKSSADIWADFDLAVSSTTVERPTLVEALDGFITRLLPDIVVTGVERLISSGMVIPAGALVGTLLGGALTALPGALIGATLGVANPLNHLPAFVTAPIGMMLDGLFHSLVGAFGGYLGGRLLTGPLFRAISTATGGILGAVVANFLTDLTSAVVGSIPGGTLGFLSSLLPNLLTRLLLPLASAGAHTLIGWPTLWVGGLLLSLIPLVMASLGIALALITPVGLIVVGIALAGLWLIWGTVIVAGAVSAGTLALGALIPAIVLTVLGGIVLIGGAILFYGVSALSTAFVLFAIAIPVIGVIALILSLGIGLPLGFIVGHILATIVNVIRSVTHSVIGALLGASVLLLAGQLLKPFTLPLGAFIGSVLGFLNPLVTTASAILTGIPGALLGAALLTPVGMLKGIILGYAAGLLGSRILGGILGGLLGGVFGSIPGVLAGSLLGGLLGLLAYIFLPPVLRGVRGDMYDRWNKLGWDDPHNRNARKLNYWLNNNPVAQLIKKITSMVNDITSKLAQGFTESALGKLIARISELLNNVKKTIIDKVLVPLTKPVTDFLQGLVDNLVAAVGLDTEAGRVGALRGLVPGAVLGSLVGALLGMLSPMNFLNSIPGAIMGAMLGAPLGALLNTLIMSNTLGFITWLATSLLHGALLSPLGGFLGAIIGALSGVAASALLGKIAGNILGTLNTIRQLLTLTIGGTILGWLTLSPLILAGTILLGSVIPSILAFLAPFATAVAISYGVFFLVELAALTIVLLVNLAAQMALLFLPPAGLVVGFATLIISLIIMSAITMFVAVPLGIGTYVMLLAPAFIFGSIFGVIAFIITLGVAGMVGLILAAFIPPMLASIIGALTAVPLFVANWLIGSVLGSGAGVLLGLLPITLPLAIVGYALGRLFGAIAGFMSPLNYIPAAIVNLLTAIPSALAGAVLGAGIGGGVGATLMYALSSLLHALAYGAAGTGVGAILGAILGSYFATKEEKVEPEPVTVKTRISPEAHASAAVLSHSGNIRLAVA